MITVEIWRRPEGFTSGFKITGHADAFEKDAEYDLICAAVSSISLTAALGLKDVLHKEGQYDSSSGYLVVDIGVTGDEKTEAVIQTMIRGLKEVSLQYPKRIRFKELIRR